MTIENPFGKLPDADRPAAKPKGPPTPDWVPVSPIPQDAPPPPDSHPKTGKPAAIYTYKDATGKVLNYQCRFNAADGSKSFKPLSLFRPAGGGPATWRWEGLNSPRSLFNADLLALHPDWPVLVCEGEKASLAALKLLPGHIATTSPNGSQSAKKASWKPLAGRTVTVWPDADEPGQKYALEAARLALEAGARAVAIATPPEVVEPGFDAADALKGGWTQAKAAAFIASAVPFSGGTSTPEATAGPEKDSRASRREDLLEIADGLSLWHCGREPYASFDWDGAIHHYPVESSLFKDWFCYQSLLKSGSAPTEQALQEMLRLLRAKALFEGPERPAWQRIGQTEGAVYVDLGTEDRKVVKVNRHGWEVVPATFETTFIRSDEMRALPVPESGESIDLLRKYLNINSEDDFVLTVAFLVGAFRQRGPHPILFFHGQPGSAKSTATEIIRSLIDPNLAPHMTLTNDLWTMAAVAASSHVFGLDNLSSITQEQSDFFCTMTTGGHYVRRALHTNRDQNVMRLNNPVVMNGVPELAGRSDFADRTTFVRLNPFPEGQRKTTEALWAEFGKDAPFILGALLNGVSSALRHFDTVQVTNLPRLADFGKFVTAAESGLGWEPGTFLAAYHRDRVAVAEAAFESDTVAIAAFEFAVSRGAAGWTGTATDLFSLLTSRQDEDTRQNKHVWPQNVTSFGTRLARAGSILSAKSVSVSHHKSGGRFITIRKASAAQAPPPESVA